MICFPYAINTTGEHLYFVKPQLSLCYKILCHNNALFFEFVYYIIKLLLFRIAK